MRRNCTEGMKAGLWRSLGALVAADFGHFEAELGTDRRLPWGEHDGDAGCAARTQATGYVSQCVMIPKPVGVGADLELAEGYRTAPSDRDHRGVQLRFPIRILHARDADFEGSLALQRRAGRQFDREPPPM